MTSATSREAILAVNAGSSSLKFAVHPLDSAGSTALPASVRGVIEGLAPGGTPSLTLEAGGAAPVHAAVVPAAGEDVFTAALRTLLERLAALDDPPRLRAIAHRIVHGGDRLTASVILDDETLAYLRSLEPLAPLHQPHCLEGVDVCRRAWPDLPQVGCFDTAFHSTLPDVEKYFALPRALADQGIRRFGFHGLSYRYVLGELAQHSVQADARVITAHLGNGASVCATRARRSVSTTMGFSALDGLAMGTRSGAVDPGVLLHLLRNGWDVERIEQLLYKESGLRGVSGLSSDMRVLRASSDPDAARAIALFERRLLRALGALTACLGGVDALVFTAGIGEHDAALRASICAQLEWLGVRLDEEANAEAVGGPARALHLPDSTVEVWMIPTDEGRIAAQDAAALLG